MNNRKNILPKWIKIFAWLFLIVGLFIPIDIISILIGNDIKFSLYGIDNSNSFINTLLISLFLLKFITAFGLLKEKKWAIKTAQLDAVLGITLCVITMVILPLFFGEKGVFKLSLRFEILFLIPFLMKINEIKSEWEKENL
jgi:hypothetical protein